MKNKLYSAKDVSQWFINRSIIDNEPIEKLKLQKLLFFSQGLHMTVNNQPLFDDDFTWFKHGPVIKSVFPMYKNVDSNEINTTNSVDIDFKTTEFLEKVYKIYGQYSGWKLREMSHKQQSYINAVKDYIISKDLINKYFESDNKDFIKQYIKLKINEDEVERLYFINKHYNAFKALA